jgi:hypothetical protein
MALPIRKGKVAMSFGYKAGVGTFVLKVYLMKRGVNEV